MVSLKTHLGTVGSVVNLAFLKMSVLSAGNMAYSACIQTKFNLVATTTDDDIRTTQKSTPRVNVEHPVQTCPLEILAAGIPVSYTQIYHNTQFYLKKLILTIKFAFVIQMNIVSAKLMSRYGELHLKSINNSQFSLIHNKKAMS